MNKREEIKCYDYDEKEEETRKREMINQTIASPY